MFNPICLEATPPNGSLWNMSDPKQFAQHVVPQTQATHQWLTEHWVRHNDIVMQQVQSDPMEPMKRPPAAEDQYAGGRTITRSMPILTGVSTSTSVDLALYMQKAEEWFGPDAYFLHLGDYSTVRNLWFNIWRSRPLYNHHCVQGDEFHLQTHHHHAAKILWYPNVIPVRCEGVIIMKQLGTTVKKASCDWSPALG